MGLNKAPCAVSQTVPIVRYKEGEGECNGGILKGNKYAWLCQGPFLSVVDLLSGEKIAGWRFGGTYPGCITKVSCVAELPHNDEENSNVKQIVVGLQCEIFDGMICILDIQGSRLLRAIRVPGKPHSINVVDNGSSGCEGRYPLPSLLSSMSGIIAVGVEGGKVFLIDLCRLSCEELLSTWFNDDREDLRDELNPCQLIPITKDDEDSDLLERKRAAAALSGDHLCLLLNEGSCLQDLFLLLDSGDVCATFKAESVGVTSLLYVPRIASLLVGYSFGCFQLWDLMHLTLNFTSRIMKDPLPVVYLGFQEPSDDPCNFCYLWAVHSSTNDFPSSNTPVGIMYALSYDSKEYVDGYGYLYQDYQSCHFRFEYNLVVDTPDNVANICCTSFSTLSNMATQKNSLSEDGYDEVTSENDFSLGVFAWEAYDAENKPVSSNVSIFDLNQWYKDQMPIRVNNSEVDPPGYIVSFSLNLVRENGEDSEQEPSPLLDIKIDTQNLSQFKSFQPQEEHYHPAALSFVSHCLLEDRIVTLNHPGLQKYILLYMEKEGPLCLLRPASLFKHCMLVGLKPVLIDINGSGEISPATQREYLLSLALENQMQGFLYRCASDWANGSVSGVDCSLPMLLTWGFQRAVILKETADGLCVHLFDHAGITLDKNECRLLDNCACQLRQLATLFEGILSDCRLLSLLNMEDFKEKTTELSLVALYFEVLLWFLNVGLLPEFPESEDCINNEDGTSDTSVLKLAYPASSIVKIYQARRQEFKSLNLKNGTKASLYIDQLLQNEAKGTQLSELWQSDGGSGMYPPPSIQSLLAMYLLGGIDIQTKNSIVIYVFLDLANILDNEKYSSIIEYFVKFPCAFCMTPSIIKVTQAFWLLDQKHFEDALDMVLDPLVSPKDLQPWQHRFIVHSLLSQNQHPKALEYFTVRQLPVQGVEDIHLKITLLVMNKQVTQAYNFLQQYYNEENNQELLLHFFQECGKAHQLGSVLKLMLSVEEEELFMNYLQNCNLSQSEDMQVLFYLMRSRVIEAVAANEKINFSNSRKVNSLRRSRNDPTIRDVLVDGYAKTLPGVTRQLANYCSQQKKTLETWRQVQRPTPMSVDVHYGTKKSISYKSSLIHATLEKARETWMMPVHSPYNGGSKLTDSMDMTTMKHLPFLCIAHDSLKNDRETTPVVFPSMTSNSAKRRFDDDGSAYTPLKRSRLETSPTMDNLLLHSKKKECSNPNSNSSVLLKSPLVKRITPYRQSNSSYSHGKYNAKNVNQTFTPHSILKVRNLDRSSASPERFQKNSSVKMKDWDTDLHQSNDERLSARQIRFSLPTSNEETKPLSCSTPTNTVNRSRDSKSPVSASPRLPIKSSLSLLKKTLLENKGKRAVDASPEDSILNSSENSIMIEKQAQQTVFVFGSDSLVNTNTEISDSDETNDDVENTELNNSQGDDSFYSAGSSNNSNSTQENSKEASDEEDREEIAEYDGDKYIHNIKCIKPRRQLSRLKSESVKSVKETVSIMRKKNVVELKIDNSEQESVSTSEDEYTEKEGLDDAPCKSVLGDTLIDYNTSTDQSILKKGNENKSFVEKPESTSDSRFFNKVTERNLSEHFMKVHEIRARRPLSRIVNSGNFESFQSSASELEVSRVTAENKDVLGSSSIMYEENVVDLSAESEEEEVCKSNLELKEPLGMVRNSTYHAEKDTSSLHVCISDYQQETGIEEENNDYSVREHVEANSGLQSATSVCKEVDYTQEVMCVDDDHHVKEDSPTVESEDHEKIYAPLTTVNALEHPATLYASGNFYNVTPNEEMLCTQGIYTIYDNQECENIGIGTYVRPSDVGDISGTTIEIDSDESGEKDKEIECGPLSSRRESIASITEIVGSDIKMGQNKSSISSISTENLSSDRKDSENTSVELRAQHPLNIAPQDVIWTGETKEEPLVLKLSDSENEELTSKDGVNLHITNKILLKEKSDEACMEDPLTIQKLPSFSLLITSCKSNATECTNKTMLMDNYSDYHNAIQISEDGSPSNVETETNCEVVEEKLPVLGQKPTLEHGFKESERNLLLIVDQCPNNETKEDIQSSTIENESHQLTVSVSTENNISEKQDKKTQPSSNETNVSSKDIDVPLEHSGILTRQRRRRSSIHCESPVVAEVTASCNQNLESLVRTNTPRRKGRSSSVQSEPPILSDLLDQEQAIEKAGVVTRQRGRRNSINFDSPIVTEATGLDDNNTSTPKTRLRSRPSSVQSEPAQLEDVLDIEQHENQSIATRKTRRRSSMKSDTPTKANDIPPNQNIMSVEKIDTPTRKLRNHRSNSVQSEPPCMTDFATLDNIEGQHTGSSPTISQCAVRMIRLSAESLNDTSKLETTKYDPKYSTPESRLQNNTSSGQSESVNTSAPEQPQPSTSRGNGERLKLNLRSHRAQSVEREMLSCSSDVENVDNHDPSAESDVNSVQSEPPSLGDVTDVKQIKSHRTRKGSSGKKKSCKVTYFLRIPPSNLSALKEEPEIESSGGDIDVTNVNRLEDTTSDTHHTRNLRSRKNSEPEGFPSFSEEHTANSFRQSRKRTDSTSSFSSKSTVILEILEQSSKRKRSTSPSSPERHESKKFLMNSQGNLAVLSEASEEESKKIENSSCDDSIEQYATARRLTRYQRKFMERSMDTTKGVGSQYSRSHGSPEKDNEDSDSESVVSNYTSGSSQVRYSTRLREKKETSVDRSPSASSQASFSPQKKVRGKRVTEETSDGSPASIRSGRSSTASSSQWPSPSSISSHHSLRPRRKLLQTTSRDLFSSRRKNASQASTGASEAGSVSESEEHVSEINPSQVGINAETASEISSSRSKSSSRSRGTCSSKNLDTTSIFGKTRKVREELIPHEKNKQKKKGASKKDTPSATEDSADNSDLPQEAIISQDVNPTEDLQERKNEGRKRYSVFKSRKYLKLHTKKKT